MHQPVEAFQESMSVIIVVRPIVACIKHFGRMLDMSNTKDQESARKPTVEEPQRTEKDIYDHLKWLNYQITLQLVRRASTDREFLNNLALHLVFGYDIELDFGESKSIHEALIADDEEWLLKIIARQVDDDYGSHSPEEKKKLNDLEKDLTLSAKDFKQQSYPLIRDIQNNELHYYASNISPRRREYLLQAEVLLRNRLSEVQRKIT